VNLKILYLFLRSKAIKCASEKITFLSISAMGILTVFYKIPVRNFSKILFEGFYPSETKKVTIREA